MAQANTVLDDNLHWYKDAIIYELHIKAFRDSNGDGIGDFNGLLEKLDYLQELGVTAIWVLPFYPSPLKDDGYDIADYYSINTRYGTIEHFKKFLDEAHNRGLKVITELVVNHTSDQHPWFQRARTAPKGSPERDFYVWTDNPNQYKDVRIIFQDFEASNWTWDPVAQQYYWHRFFHHQPDLNYDSPLVQQEILKVLDYWCAMGVDGFRLDAVPYLFEREGTNGENLPETHAFLKKMRQYVDEHYPGTVFLAEANMWPEDSASYYGNGDECHMNYHFPVMPRMFMALQMEDRYPITDIFDQTPAIPDTCQWAMFLRNHDELTLEMVTDEERDFMYKVYAKDPKAKINLGIRHRLAPLMDNDRRRIELMNSLLFSFPGTPVIYYGDEIGMGDNFYLGDRDGVRTPMQWSPDRNAGFSSSNPHQLYLPVILDPEYHYESVNVEMQRRNTSSLFWFMKRVINLRKTYKAFGRGDMQFIPVDNPKILAFTRSYEGETLLIIVNLSKHAQPAELDLKAFKGYQPVEIFGKNRFPVVKEAAPYFFTLTPHAFQWYLLEKVNTEAERGRQIPVLEMASWENPWNNQALRQLQTHLPAYLQSRKWFQGKKRPIYNVSIMQHAVLPPEAGITVFLLLEVVYKSGLPELYQLAITLLKGEAATKIAESFPEAIFAYINNGEQKGVWCDALYTPELQQFLMANMAASKSIPLQSGSLQFNGSSNIKQKVGTDEAIDAKMHGFDENNTAVTYANTYFLKLYRKVDFTQNPDVEIIRLLSEQLHFKHVPAFFGTVEWQLEKGTVVLGMMQELVENHGDGHSYMLERVANFIERIKARNVELADLEAHAGTLTEPAAFDALPAELQDLLGARAAEQMRLLGERLADLHLALENAGNNNDFKPEAFSLHYQRSLFSSMQSLVRETFQSLQRNISNMPAAYQGELKELLGRRQDILDTLKQIYKKKLDVLKIRIHGNFELQKVLLSGKDLMIQDFSGNRAKPFSERRLKRSPIRDVATMVCSIHYTAYEGFFMSYQVQKAEVQAMLSFATLWADYMSGVFMNAYFEKVHHTAFIPDDKGDLAILMQTYLLERALQYFNSDLEGSLECMITPLRLIQSVLGQAKEITGNRSVNTVS
jgi:maltose alpha-D-glucosyltransferase/alpha-amylase